MTMRIDRQQKIAGVSIVDLRDLLRRYDDAFRADWLTDRGYKKAEAEAIVGGLLDQGYIEPQTDPPRYDDSGFQWYWITRTGRSLARASAARPVSRAHAEKTLADFLGRVEVVNRDPRFLVGVSKVVVFGSYLGTAPELGDLDIACEYQPKIDDPQLRTEQYTAHFLASGRPYKHIVSDQFWPREEVELFLKKRQRTISLQPMHSFIGMPKDENFRYKVLLGDESEIAMLLSQPTGS